MPERGGPQPRSLKRRAGALAVASSSVAALQLRKRLGLPAAVTTASLFSAPVALARVAAPSFTRDMAVWGAQMWAYKNAFELPADDAKRHQRRRRIDYPLRVDTLLGFGVPPSRRLQRRLRHRRRLSGLDKGLTFLYWTWEAEPHLVMAAIRKRWPDLFASAAGRLAAAFDLRLVAYWIVPTAPPWWVSEHAGRMDGDVRRVMIEVLRWVKGQRRPTAGKHELERANAFASMPSDHFGSAAMTAMIMSDLDPRLGAAGWAYALLLGFTLVYLGEHYVTDLVAGLGLALALNRRRDPLERLGRAVLDG
jgi:membrane-associated phospholipid phosphatase